jgi:hypothetical protein
LLDYGFGTPADAAAPAIGAAVFHRRGDWQRLPLTAVPKVIFSEVMRDLDLVVSGAHVGGVDPEATQSTVALRADLLRETCKLLQLANVTLESPLGRRETSSGCAAAGVAFWISLLGLGCWTYLVFGLLRGLYRHEKAGVPCGSAKRNLAARPTARGVSDWRGRVPRRPAPSALSLSPGVRATVWAGNPSTSTPTNRRRTFA